MSQSTNRILVTGSSGQLGRLVIAKLLETQPANQIVGLMRDPAKGADLSAKGVEIRQGDYENRENLSQALEGIGRVLLISSSEIGRRLPQHKNFITAAKRAGVNFLAYTSLLHADISPMGLAEEHKATEAAIKESGLPHAILRNGWYSENLLLAIPAAVEHGVLFGGSGDGRISSASRKDFAEAAATVMATAEYQAGKVYELAGDTSFTRADFAAEIARHAGKPVEYKNLPEAEYKALMIQIGLPEPLAAMLADSDKCAASGSLFYEGKELSSLIGRPTTPFDQSVKAAFMARAA